MRSPHPPLVSAIAVAVAYSLLGASSEAVPVFSDGDFDRAHWTTTVLGGGGSGTVSTTGSGGNPGAFSSVDTIEGIGGWVLVADLNNSAIVDPSLLGGIASLDYSEDYRCPSSDCFGAGQSQGLVLLQGGSFYIVNPFTFFTGVQPDWTNLSLPGLMATSFGRIDPSAPTTASFFQPGFNPDFSPSGAPIQLGYYRANGDINSSITGHLDNWFVSVNPANLIPEPGPVTLMFLGLLGLAIRGRASSRPHGRGTPQNRWPYPSSGGRKA